MRRAWRTGKAGSSRAWAEVSLTMPTTVRHWEGASAPGMRRRAPMGLERGQKRRTAARLTRARQGMGARGGARGDAG